MGNSISTWFPGLRFGFLVDPSISLSFLEIQTPKKFIDSRDLISTCSLSAIAAHLKAQNLPL